MARVIAFGHDELRGVHLPPRSRGCDFCATGMPIWHYPARTIGLGTICYGEDTYRSISIGHWAACWECSELVEAGDWPALARHTVRSLNIDLSQAGPGTRVKLLAWTHHAHEQFRKARNGPRAAVV